MAGDDGDGDDGIRYPRTINEELIELGQLLDNIDDMGDAAAALFGRSDAAPIDLDGAAASVAAAAAGTSPSNATSLASSTTGKHRSPV
jgi:hypothetical protein